MLCLVGFLNTAVAHAATVELPAGGDLQAAINAARPGDTILLTAGVTYIGNFVLPVKSGSDYITIRTADRAGQPAASVRVWPSHSNLLAKIRSNNSAAALRTAPGAHHWRLQLLEFPSTFEGYGDILQIGDGSHAQNTLAKVPYAIELDRLFIHGDSVMGQKRGVALNAADVRIRNCYISDIKAVGMDAQAIGGWNGPGPFVIENNYLEASGENFLLGGSDPGVPNLVSENVTFRHNYVSRPMSWRDPILPAPAQSRGRAQRRWFSRRRTIHLPDRRSRPGRRGRSRAFERDGGVQGEPSDNRPRFGSGGMQFLTRSTTLSTAAPRAVARSIGP